MDNLFERLTALLGKSKDDNSFELFIHDLGEQPQIYLENEVSTEYFFKRSGIFLSYFFSGNCFAQTIIHATGEDGVALYEGNLPNGIRFGESKEIVEEKIGTPRYEPKSSDIGDYNEFEVNDLLIGFRYVRRKLERLHIRYIPAWDLERGCPKRWTVDS